MQNHANFDTSNVQVPMLVVEPGPAELSAAGHWGETQVIQSIKEATFRGKSPQLALSGKATQPLGGGFRPVTDLPVGRLITPQPRMRTRLKRFLKTLLQ